MKTFFDGIFINSSTQEEEPEYPIKLEYYKTVKIEENVKAQYGIEIVKTEFLQGKVNVENKVIDNITDNEKDIEHILTILKDNEVTPIGMQDVIDDMFITI